MINGPIPYSADADFVMGKVPELDNYYVADRVPVRHRRRRWRRQDDGGVDPRRAAVARSVAARRAPVRVPSHDASLHGLAHGRAVRASLQARCAGHRARHVARREAQPVARHAGIARRGVRIAWRMGAAELVRADGVEAVDRPSFSEPNWFPHVAEEHRRRAASASPSSTRRRSPSSRSPGPARSTLCSGCRSPTWTRPSALSRTHSSATSAAGSSAI